MDTHPNDLGSITPLDIIIIYKISYIKTVYIRPGFHYTQGLHHLTSTKVQAITWQTRKVRTYKFSII